MDIVIRQNGRTCELLHGDSLIAQGERVQMKRLARELHAKTGDPVWNWKDNGRKCEVNYKTPTAMTTHKPATDRFGLPEVNYQDAMERGNSLAQSVIANPGDFSFDERVLCRAFCFSAKEEILAIQRGDAAAAERDQLVDALRKLSAGNVDCGTFWKVDAADMENARALLAELGEEAT